jgi:hypothetical protein
LAVNAPSRLRVAMLIPFRQPGVRVMPAFPLAEPAARYLRDSVLFANGGLMLDEGGLKVAAWWPSRVSGSMAPAETKT